MTAALKGAMENASKCHTARIKDLMAACSGKQGNDSQQKVDRLREEEVDVSYRASYQSLRIPARYRLAARFQVDVKHRVR